MVLIVFLKAMSLPKLMHDWGGYKGETGDQGFGISSLDVVFLVTDAFQCAKCRTSDGANM